MSRSFCICAFCFVGLVAGHGHDEGDLMESLGRLAKIPEPPIIVHEIPPVTRCSCCRTVLAKISEVLRLKLGSKQSLSDDEYVPALVEACRDSDLFSGYSLSGDKTLERPADGQVSSAEDDKKWRRSLQATCEKIRQTVGEESIWDMFIAGKQEIPSGHFCSKEVRLCPRSAGKQQKSKSKKASSNLQH
mmetsp:Transcript_32820/g.57936  ORF Transcript_32820/g.57936 Transcript_32820/m.57936 type:complete len:189 (+) Transcript_32820:70-636(+)